MADGLRGVCGERVQRAVAEGAPTGSVGALILFQDGVENVVLVHQYKQNNVEQLLVQSMEGGPNIAASVNVQFHAEEGSR